MYKNSHWKWYTIIFKKYNCSINIVDTLEKFRVAAKNAHLTQI